MIFAEYAFFTIPIGFGIAIVAWGYVEWATYRPCKVCGAPYAALHVMVKHVAHERRKNFGE